MLFVKLDNSSFTDILQLYDDIISGNSDIKENCEIRSPTLIQDDNYEKNYDYDIQNLIEEYYGPDSSRSKNCRNEKVDQKIQDIYDEFGIADIMLDN